MRFSRTRRTSSSGRWCVASRRVTYVRDKKISLRSYRGRRSWSDERLNRRHRRAIETYFDVTYRADGKKKKKETCFGGDTSIKVISWFVDMRAIYFWKFNNILLRDTLEITNSSQKGIERDKLSRLQWNFEKMKWWERKLGVAEFSKNFVQTLKEARIVFARFREVSLVLDATRYFFESIVALSCKCHESIYESITCITDSGGSLKGEALAALQLRCASSLRDTRGEARFN